MPLSVQCPSCGKRYALVESLAGRNVKCKVCSNTFTVPNTTQPLPPPLPPAEPREWHLGINGAQQGPFTRGEVVEKILRGAVEARTLAWCARLTDWQMLGSLSEFQGCFQTAGVPPTQPPSPGQGAQGTGSFGGIRHAGFGYRLAAFLIDNVVTLPLDFVAALILIGLANPFGEVSTVAWIFICAMDTLIFIIYNACLERTTWQGSIGKKLVGIYVQRVDGQALDFGMAFQRNLPKIYAFAPFLFPNAGLICLFLVGVALIIRWHQAKAKADFRSEFWYDRQQGCLVLRRA